MQPPSRPAEDARDRHEASMTYDPATDAFTVRCRKAGCPMAEGAGAVMRKPHNMYNRSRGPHGFAHMTNWATATKIRTADGPFETIANLAVKHHRPENGQAVTRSNTMAIRAFLTEQLTMGCQHRVLARDQDGAATIMYRVCTDASPVRKRRILPEATAPRPADKKARVIIEDDGEDMPPEARLGLDEFISGMRSSRVADFLASKAASEPPGREGSESDGDGSESDGEDEGLVEAALDSASRTVALLAETLKCVRRITRQKRPNITDVSKYIEDCTADGVHASNSYLKRLLEDKRL